MKDKKEEELLKEVKELKKEITKEHKEKQKERSSSALIWIGIFLMIVAFFLWRCGISIGLFD